MKNSLIILFILITSCCSSKKNSSGKASVNEQAQVVTDQGVNENTSPECIKKMIEQFKSEEVQNPPRKIYRYLYNGRNVYYVNAPCCDFYSELYDSNCKLIAHPDGGITGKGDGKAVDFMKIRTEEKLIWADKRK